jgi:hypothetical protein
VNLRRRRRRVPLDVVAAAGLIVLSLLAAWPVWAARPPVIDYVVHYPAMPAATGR